MQQTTKMMKIAFAYFLSLSLVCIDSFSAIHEQNDLDQYILQVTTAQEHDSLLSLVRGQRSTSHKNSWELAASRTVRNAGNDQPQQCCNIPKKELTDKATNSLLACIQEVRPSGVGDEELKKHSMKQVVCLTQCLGKKYGLLDGNGFVLKDKITEFAKTESDDEVFNQKEDIIARCTDFSKKFADERGEVKFFEKSCNMAPLVFTQCLKGFVEVNCSEEKKVKTDVCDMSRMRLAEFIEIWKI